MIYFSPCSVATLTQLLSNLCSETSNSWNDFLQMDFHFVLGIHNSIIKRKEEEAKRQKDEESKYKTSAPSMPSMSSIKSQIPKPPSIPSIRR